MRFTKMQGVGNDFVLVDAEKAGPNTDFSAMAIAACARHVGAGADGLLVVERSPTLSMRMFNPDGTEDMCGNGLRCAALWMHRAGWVQGTQFTIATREGPRLVELLDADNAQGLLRVNMGVPHLLAGDIPFRGTAGRVVDFPLTVDGREVRITSLHTGSAHTVIFGPAPDEDTFQRVSPLIEHHALFPERTSVLWATPGAGGASFAVRIWERGVGETLGCGTGACAVGVAAQLQGLAGTEPVDIVSRGGTLRIAWAGQDVMMTGPAQFVYEGEWAVGRA